VRPPGGRASCLLLTALAAAIATGHAVADPAPISTRLPLVSPAAGPANPLLRVLLLEAGRIEPRAAGGPLRLLDAEGRERMLLPAGERLRISREGGALGLERPDSPDPRQAAPLRLPLQMLTLEPVLEATIANDPREANAAQRSLSPTATTTAAAAATTATATTATATPGNTEAPASTAPLVGLDRRSYRGSLVVRPEGTGLQAVNLIPLEVYLPSVVGSEMPARWPAAALQAQAVAARTYALSQRRPDAAFDLRATVASQAYIGVEAETDSTLAAVAATRPLVLRFGGDLIQAVFHSSSGGSTENSGEIWARQLPYLVSVPDGDDPSPWREWTLRFDPEQLRRAFRETEGASRIEVLSTSSTGRVRRARVIGPGGSLELSGGELRQRLGLRSTLVRFRFEEPPATGAGLPTGAVSGITTATALAGAGMTAAPLTGSDPRSLRQRLALPPGPSPTGELQLELWPGLAPPPPLGEGRGESAGGGGNLVALPTLLAQPLPSLEVSGRGFGHGVGMSQWGAYALALRGYDYRAILGHYYRGAELQPFSGR
jgi:stage II sporulation protein D